MIKVGIDPGVTGAVAIIPEDNLASVWDMPVFFDGKKNRVHANELYELLFETLTKDSHTFIGKDSHVFIEKVHAMPGQGVTSSFNFGLNYGVVIGVAGALGVPYTLVTPKVWKKHAGLLKKPKDMARFSAKSLYPHLTSRLARKKDIDRAEALLIAHHGEQILWKKQK